MSSIFNLSRSTLAVRYASDTSGTNFSADKDNSRKYIGIKVIDDPNKVLVASDFTGLWQRYVGDIEFDSWYSISDGSQASYTLSTDNGCQQKINVSSNSNGTITLTAPTLSSLYPTFLLEITKTGTTNIQVGSTVVLDTSKVGVYNLCWCWNGTTTKRFLPVELF